MDQTTGALIILTARAAKLADRIAGATLDASNGLKSAASLPGDAGHADNMRCIALNTLVSVVPQLAEVQALIASALALSK